MLNTALGGIYRTGFQGQFKDLREDIYKTGIEWNRWSAETILWASRNYADFCTAVITGNYTVKQEQLYYVILAENKGGFKYCFWNRKGTATLTSEKEGIDKFTESEIKAKDERYWPFAVPVKEETK